MGRYKSRHVYNNDERTGADYQAKISGRRPIIDQRTETTNNETNGNSVIDNAYRESIYARTTICRINISIAIITLSQNSLNPAKIQYKAIKTISVYLNNTKRGALTNW